MYDRIISFGCSFTEGGGLNSYTYHNYKYGTPVPELIEERTPTEEMNQYATLNAYPKRLAEIIGCESENHGKSTGSNEWIFNKVYDRIHNHNTMSLGKEKILVTIQTSLLSRLMVYHNNTKQFLNINNPIYAPDQFIGKYYEMYLTHYYNEYIQWQLLLKNIDLYNNWLTSKNIDVIFILYENLNHKNLHKLPVVNFDFIDPYTKIKINNFSLGDWSSSEQLTIDDLENYPENDRHFSIEGHQKIAEIIYEYLIGNGYG